MCARNLFNALPAPGQCSSDYNNSVKIMAPNNWFVCEERINYNYLNAMDRLLIYLTFKTQYITASLTETKITYIVISD